MRLAIPGTTLNPTNRPTNSPQMKIHTGAFFHILRSFFGTILFYNARKRN